MLADMNPADPIKRTTVRLPKELHTRLRNTALSSGITAEEIIRRALVRELESTESLAKDSAALDLYNSVRKALDAFRQRTNLATLEAAQPIEETPSWSPVIAYRFLQHLPALAVIKDNRARIIWCNTAYEHAFGRSLAQIQGRTTGELGFTGEGDRAGVDKDIRRVLKSGKPMESIETVQVPGRPLVLRVHRFIFIHPTSGEVLLGDVSFDVSRFAHHISDRASQQPTSPPVPVQMKDEELG